MSPQGTSDDSKKFMSSTSCSNIKLPMIEVRELGSTIEVILVSFNTHLVSITKNK